MGPFCVTGSNPTHQLTDPTQPNTSGNIWTQPDPNHYNEQWSLQFSSDVFLYTELIGFRYLSERPQNQI